MAAPPPRPRARATQRLRPTTYIVVADWNSDGLPDLLQVNFRHVDFNSWFLPEFWEHAVSRDLKYDSHFTSYEDIEITGTEAFLQTLDWNKDKWADVLVAPDLSIFRSNDLYVYEVTEKNAKKVAGVFDQFRLRWGHAESFRLVDLGGNGTMHLIVTSESRLIVYHQMVSGQFQVIPDHPLSQMRLAFPNEDKQIVPVDWDQDGDLDLLVLALEYMDAQYFEQQANGSFREKPLEETPFKPLLPGFALHPAFAWYLSWHFRQRYLRPPRGVGGLPFSGQYRRRSQNVFCMLITRPFKKPKKMMKEKRIRC